MMSEMLTEFTPSDVDSSDLELLQVSIGPELSEIFKWKIVIFFLSTSLNVLWVLKRTVSLRRFF